MKITGIKATTIAVPLEAPIRHANGAHWGRFIRTIVEVETDEGITGLGEMGGGGESAENAFKALKSYLVGHDPFQLEAMYWKICNPTASLYNNRTQLHAALEFACIDIMGKKLGIRACDLLGGALREEVPFASYLFFRYVNEQTGKVRMTWYAMQKSWWKNTALQRINSRLVFLIPIMKWKYSGLWQKHFRTISCGLILMLHGVWRIPSALVNLLKI